MIRKTRLYTPGPTPLLPAAQFAMAAADMHHRTAEFRALFQKVLAQLKVFVGTKNDVLLLSCSGTGAMEASVSNLTSPGDKVLVLTAGKFGERWTGLAKAFGCEPEVLTSNTWCRLEPSYCWVNSTKGYFNEAAFIDPYGTTTGHTTPACADKTPGWCGFGDTSKNAYFGPGVFGINSSIMKNWTLREGKTFQFRWDAFNATNHPNFSGPASTVNQGAGTFGIITGVNSPSCLPGRSPLDVLISRLQPGSPDHTIRTAFSCAIGRGFRAQPSSLFSAASWATPTFV